jgi:ABC-type transport system involved in cytochrome bd biosynthesis fused ATPase/permease subunit
MFDPAGEAEFLEECREVFAQRTVLLITHRVASLAVADRIIRMEVRDAGGAIGADPSSRGT